MRVSDENKKKAIGKAVVSLINSEGIDGLSMSKIASFAGVSPSTIYTYYTNREEMLIALYIGAKEEFATYLNKNFSSDMTIKDGFRVLLDNILEFYRREPGTYHFIQQFSKNPLAEKVCEDVLQTNFASILDFVHRGIREKIIKDLSIDYISAFVFEPIAHIVAVQKREGGDITDEDVHVLFSIIWDGLRE